jgi:hypothetical protein
VLTVVVATTPTDPVTYSYSLTSRSAPAVQAFAEAVRRALPVRDADEPRPQVSAEPVERSGPHLGYATLGALLLTYVLVAVVLVNRGAGERAVVLWLAGPMLTGAGSTVLPGGVRTVREAVVLRRRGITVEGRHERWHHQGRAPYRRAPRPRSVPPGARAVHGVGGPVGDGRRDGGPVALTAAGMRLRTSWLGVAGSSMLN